MNNIRVDIRLRPIRFGFLVRPDDDKNILEIFRINTCLWGGKFNPIIPIFESVPSWLEEEGFHFENPNQMINDYLDFFEPDFLVEAEEGLAEGFGFDPVRVRKLADMIEVPGGNYVNRYGLSVHGLYTDLYAKEFQFAQRHKKPFVDIYPTDTAFTNFAACLFGSFPSQERLAHFTHTYRVIFNPELVEMDGDALVKLYQLEYSSPLDITCKDIQVSYNAPLLSTLYLLNAHNSEDIVDFWNLRAIHQHILPIPIQWIEELSPFCKKFIKNNYRRQPDDSSGRMVGPVMMFSRSLSEKNVKEISENYPFIDENDIYTVQRWSPTIWYKLSEQVASPTRPTLIADRKVMTLPFDGDNPEIRFDPLFPDFMSEFNQYRVANVVKLQDWSEEGFLEKVRDRTINDQIASVFPINYKKPTILKFLPDFLQEHQFILSTTEGLAFFPYREDFDELWNLVDGTTAFNQWFNENKIPATRSDAGSTTEQIIQTLGGLGQGVFCLTYKEVVELLDKMSNRITKSFHYEKFQSKIDEAFDSEILKDRILKTLLKQRVVELGLELKCSECRKWSWYSLKQLDYSLICNFCFKQFTYPIIDPTDKKHSKWAYRVVGPFALPDYAQGGYAAALAIRFITNTVGGYDEAGVTWSSGQELTLNPKKHVEVDYMLWFRRLKKIYGSELSIFGDGLPNFGIDRSTDTIFGEAKSFRRFEEKDVSKMKSLAEKFPGSILVFATMNEKLSPSEIKRIKELAEWGRKFHTERRQTRAPVIILTGTELFTSGFLQRSWEDEDGKHKILANRVTYGKSNLRILANYTQHLYLDMEMLPYGPTIELRRKINKLKIEYPEKTETKVMGRYPDYKVSEICWISQIPSHWQTNTINHLTENLDGKRIPLSGDIREKQEKIYPYYGANGVIDYVEDYIFEGEHILIGEDGAPFFDKTKNVSMLVSNKFWVNNHCHILRNKDKSNAGYIVHCLNSVDYYEYITGSTRDKLTQRDLNRIKIPEPPIQEQHAITNFLDRKTEQIDELIHIKERKIELLQEQRTALINHAVTKGLDPHVEMKPSGIEWIGEIPKHWDLCLLKYTARLIYGDSLISEDREDGVVPVYGSNGIIDTHSSANTLSPAIIVGRKGSLGKVQFSDIPCYVIDTAYYIDRNTSNVNLRWLYYVLNALKLERFQNSIVPGLNRENAESQHVPQITIDQQTQIADFLDQKTKQIDELTTNEHRKIELLKEYRQSLISEAVTGKIDVRNENQNMQTYTDSDF